MVVVLTEAHNPAPIGLISTIKAVVEAPRWTSTKTAHTAVLQASHTQQTPVQ